MVKMRVLFVAMFTFAAGVSSLLPVSASAEDPAGFQPLVVCQDPSVGEAIALEDPTWNVIIGTSFRDQLWGADNKKDIIYGLEGADIIKGRDGGDILCGGLGSDAINGGLGPDVIVGDFGDLVDLPAVEEPTDDKGPLSSDFLVGADGDDVIIGGVGMDAIYAGVGTDSITGNLAVVDALTGRIVTEADDNTPDYVAGGPGTDEVRRISSLALDDELYQDQQATSKCPAVPHPSDADRYLSKLGTWKSWRLVPQHPHGACAKLTGQVVPPLEEGSDDGDRHHSAEGSRTMVLEGAMTFVNFQGEEIELPDPSSLLENLPDDGCKVLDTPNCQRLVVEYMPRDKGKFTELNDGDSIVMTGLYVLDGRKENDLQLLDTETDADDQGHHGFEIHPVYSVKVNQGSMTFSGPMFGGSPNHWFAYETRGRLVNVDGDQPWHYCWNELGEICGRYGTGFGFR
jgi:hypothetical protein